MSTNADPHGPLHGRVAMVTGGARGIGREITLAMSRAGADVVVTARSLEAAERTVKEIEAVGGRGLALEADVRDRAAIEAGIARAADELGTVDILICNSGVGGPSSPLWEVEDGEWDDVFDVNVTGAFVCARAALPGMISAGRGVVLLIGSLTGKRPLLHRSPYAASKMALVGLCRTLALDAGSHGIRTNVISPGFVAGERLEWVIERQAEAQGIGVDEARAKLLADIPLNRFTPATDVASVAVFLASDAAAGITGEDVNVSSGQVMY